MMLKLALGAHQLILTLKLLHNRTWTQGIDNACQDGRYVFFADYDNTPLDFVVGDIKFIQDKYRLSHAYVMRSGKNSYHVIIPDKLALKELLQVLDDCSCDPAYRRTALSVDYAWVLRTEPKGDRPAPEFCRVILSDYNEFEKSAAHLKFLSLKHGLDELCFHQDWFGADYAGADDSSVIGVRKYETITRVNL